MTPGGSNGNISLGTVGVERLRIRADGDIVINNDDLNASGNMSRVVQVIV